MTYADIKEIVMDFGSKHSPARKVESGNLWNEIMAFIRNSVICLAF